MAAAVATSNVPFNWRARIFTICMPSDFRRSKSSPPDADAIIGHVNAIGVVRWPHRYRSGGHPGSVFQGVGTNSPDESTGIA